jgi:hypothetical protein
MTTMMHFVVWTALQLGIPICDIDPTVGQCGERQQISDTRSSDAYSSDSRDVRKVWKIYNGF